MVTETTTIQVSNELVEKLKNRKMFDKESYEDIIWDLMEDSMELSDETKINIAKAEKNIKEGRVHKWEDIKKRHKLNV